VTLPERKHCLLVILSSVGHVFTPIHFSIVTLQNSFLQKDSLSNPLNSNDSRNVVAIDPPVKEMSEPSVRRITILSLCFQGLVRSRIQSHLNPLLGFNFNLIGGCHSACGLHSGHFVSAAPRNVFLSAAQNPFGTRKQKTCCQTNNITEFIPKFT